MAIQIGVGNFSGAIASNIYRSQDSPRFLIGREFDNSSIVTTLYIFADCLVFDRWC